MKKYLIFVLISFFLSILNVNAFELPTITVGSSSSYIGEKVIIPITIENNSGFNYLGAKIRYDSTKLEYVSSTLKGFDKAYMKGLEINNYKTITLYALTATNELTIDDNGVIGEIEFKVIADNLENIPIEITIDNFGKGEDEDIEIKSNNGNVKVLKHGVIGEKEDLSEKIPENNDGNVTWQSSNEDVATVDENGNVTFKGDGDAIIEAVDKEGNTIYQKEYKVDSKKDKENSKESNNIYLCIGIPLVLVTLFLCIIFLIKKKGK